MTRTLVRRADQSAIGGASQPGIGAFLRHVVRHLDHGANDRALVRPLVRHADQGRIGREAAR